MQSKTQQLRSAHMNSPIDTIEKTSYTTQWSGHLPQQNLRASIILKSRDEGGDIF